MMTDIDSTAAAEGSDRSTHTTVRMSTRLQRIEVITRGERRRRWSLAVRGRSAQGTRSRADTMTTDINQPAEGLADPAYDQRRIDFGPLGGLEYSSICL
jgi:hypothetical protein